MMGEPSSVLLVEQKSEKGLLKMFCKYCGSKMDSDNPVCPNCGTQVSLSGGNGFWDMAGEPKREITQQPSPPPIVKEKVVVKEVKKSPIIPIAISAAFCLLCFFAMALGHISAKKTEQEYKSQLRQQQVAYETQKTQIEQLRQQQIAYETQIEQLESKIGLLEEELSQSSEPQRLVEVLHSPTSETKSEGYRSNWGCLFQFKIKGSATEFHWEKQLSDGTWTALEFDEHGVDSRYGLKIKQDLEHGESKLIADGLTQESAGNYKCTAVTSYGSEAVEVSLTIKPNSTPLPSPTITSSPYPVPSSTPEDVTEEEPIYPADENTGTDITQDDGQDQGSGNGDVFTDKVSG